MKKILLLALLALPSVAKASPFYDNSFDGSSTMLKMMGRFAVSKSTRAADIAAPVLNIDGPRGLFQWLYGVNAATAAFTGTGQAIYSIVTSSGISVAAGGVTAPWFSATTGFFGTLFGNAATATLATTATNLASGSAGTLPYQSAAGTTAMLAAGTLNYVLSSGGTGAPSWTAAASSATNIVGGAAGSLPYQTAANTTTTLAAGTNGQILSMNTAGTAPSWRSSLATTVSISTQNVVPGFNGASNFVQMDASAKLPAIDGSQLTGIAGTLAGGQSGYIPRWTSATTQGSSTWDDSGSSSTAHSDVLISSAITVGQNAYLIVNAQNGIIVNTSGEAVWATSIDGATQSSGCVVAVNASATTVGATYQFTSTTTVVSGSASALMIGVLLQSCIPGNRCLVGIRGVYRVFGSDAAGTSYANNDVSFSTTRCRITGTGTLFGGTDMGRFLNTNSDGTSAAINISITGY